MKILLSGFNRFGDLAVNSSQVIVEEIEKRWPRRDEVDLTTEILPTEYSAAENRIRGLIREIRPDSILSLGVADGESSIRLERVALNWDDECGPDNAGEIRLGQPIVDGPSSYWSTLPLEDIRDTLLERGIPVIFSNHAGTYVCNHVFYSALHEVALLNLQAKSGFIHLPSISESKRLFRKRSGLPQEIMVSAIISCLDVIVSIGLDPHS